LTAVIFGSNYIDMLYICVVVVGVVYLLTAIISKKKYQNDFIFIAGTFLYMISFTQILKDIMIMAIDRLKISSYNFKKFDNNNNNTIIIIDFFNKLILYQFKLNLFKLMKDKKKDTIK
jgi:hypothetical protein